jgi:plastocyanin
MSKFIILAAAGFVGCASLAHAADVNIDQVGQKFSMPSVTVKAGDTLHFKNQDDVTHNINVINSSDDADDKGLQKPGETIDQKFPTAGDYMVRCSIHPKMKMSVKVQ